MFVATLLCATSQHAVAQANAAVWLECQSKETQGGYPREFKSNYLFEQNRLFLYDEASTALIDLCAERDPKREEADVGEPVVSRVCSVDPDRVERVSTTIGRSSIDKRNYVTTLIIYRKTGAFEIKAGGINSEGDNRPVTVRERGACTPTKDPRPTGSMF